MSKKAPWSPTKTVLLFGIMALILAFFAFGGRELLNLEPLKAQQLNLIEFYQQYPAITLSLFFLIYVATTALSLPGATILGLTAGAIFGLAAGALTVSFASTIGATLACAASRFIFGDWFNARFQSKFEPVHKGFETNGPYYLFTLRLVPAVPFFIINIGMGLTPIPLRTFYWVSQLGMLPGTLVYVNAGTELGGIQSLQDLLSPQLVLALALLGLLPLVAKKVITWHRH